MSAETIKFGTFAQRLEHYCHAVGVAAPEIVYEDGEALLTDDLSHWLQENEPNCKWLICGDPTEMVRRWAEEQSQCREVLDTMSRLEPPVAEGLRAMLHAVVEHGLSIDEPLQIFDKVMKDWRASQSDKQH